MLRAFVGLLLLIAPFGSKAENYKDYIGKQVYVLRSISRRMWVVFDKPGGQQLFFAKKVVLKNTSFHVDEELRQQVIKLQRRLPHAGVIGTLAPAEFSKNQPSIFLRYDPYELNWFVNAENGIPIKSARRIEFLENGNHLGFGSKTFSHRLYSLMNSKGDLYLSPHSAPFVGNLKMKAFGKPDCQETAKWFSRGRGVKERVFSSEVEFRAAKFKSVEK